MTDVNQTLIVLSPGVKLLIQTFLSLFCCVVGSWILFGQWWIEIWIYICQAKGWPTKNYSLAPGGGILLAIGIYFIPVPTNGYEWIRLLTSSVQPFWWLPLVIDPFHIMVVYAIIFVIVPYLYRRYWKRIHNTPMSDDAINPHESENRRD